MASAGEASLADKYLAHPNHGLMGVQRQVDQQAVGIALVTRWHTAEVQWRRAGM